MTGRMTTPSTSIHPRRQNARIRLGPPSSSTSPPRSSPRRRSYKAPGPPVTCTTSSGVPSGSGRELTTYTRRSGQGHHGLPTAGSNVVRPMATATVVAVNSGIPWLSLGLNSVTLVMAGQPSGAAEKPSRLSVWWVLICIRNSKAGASVSSRVPPVLDQPDLLDRMFHALADPTRRAIVVRLSQGPASVSTLAEPLPMSLAAVGQHVRVLNDSGLVRTEKVGRVRTCRLEAGALHSAEQWIARHRGAWELRLDRLGDVLSDLEDQEAP